MRPLSPIEAISPAVARTRAVLLQPFRLGRSWKLAFFAYVAFCGSIFFPFTFFYLAIPKPSGAGAFFTYALWTASIVGTAICFAIYYLGSRMQFVLLDFVLSPSPRIAPLWRRYGSITWRWIAVKLAITFPLALIVFLPLYPLIKRIIALFPKPQIPSQPPDPALIGAILSIYLVLFAALGLLFLVASILSDFILPSLALENTPVRESLQRFTRLCQREPLAFIGYLAMRILLAIVGFMLQYAATLVVTLILFLVLGAVAFGGWFALHAIVSRSLLIVGAVFLYFILFVCLFYVQLGTFGALIIFFRAYSLFFLGGRYPLLGQRLEPATLVVPLPPPPPYSLAPQPLPPGAAPI